MPATVLPPVPHYVPAPQTKEPLEYADLTIIDLSKADTYEGRTKLAVQLRDAMVTQGFFYVINHGLTQAQNERIFDVADIPFSAVSDEEKRTYVANIKATGSYQGYKPRQYWHIDAGVHDQIEHYNINRDVTKKLHPQALRPLIPEIEAFAKFNHFHVLHPLLRLFALGLELPEDTFVNIHEYDAAGESYVRFMKYYPRTQDEETKTKNVWLKGHTDFGSVSILWSQPVASLQILSPDGKWKNIKHIDNALVVNAGDAMDFLSGGFYKGTVHRVIQPPPDQQGYTRLGVFYFCMPNDDTKLSPSPRARSCRGSRTSAYGQTELKAKEKGVEEEIINGVVVKHWN
ncbi:Clavaminate synthase-like protein [Fomitopsis serialis]|uniref:Clavaminate synthase-like protein n=1 Tax=Fomitopsis serialis TaxID=139415 RepID=UPI00200723B8|nr:Clavaminate synthase-like protein [Neoantrodia serialis]KAH9921818.1 Clavaminate synthase-like protein [Neoantrodia serialis]